MTTNVPKDRGFLKTVGASVAAATLMGGVAVAQNLNCYPSEPNCPSNPQFHNPTDDTSAGNTASNQVNTWPAGYDPATQASQARQGAEGALQSGSLLQNVPPSDKPEPLNPSSAPPRQAFPRPQ